MTKEIKHKKDIKTGSVLLVNSQGVLPDLIHEFQGDEYNHAGICVWLFDTLYVFEAIAQGQAFTKFDDYIKKQNKGEVNLLLLEPKKKEFEKVKDKELWDFILPLTQKPYEYKNLLIYQTIKFIGIKIGKLFGQDWDWWIGKKNYNKAFICGELVAYIYNHFLGWFKEWYKLAPVKLHLSEKFNHYLINIKSKIK